MASLWRESAIQVAAMVRSAQVSALEVAQAALARMAAVDPAINAIADPLPDEAIAAARAIDARIARGEAVGPLAGVPVTIKVNVDQLGRATTNGLRTQRDLVATLDSPVVANLRRAGAVIVGRTNTPAFSLRWFTRNGLHGHTRNPRDPAITPGGSSGGAAAAVAAGICAIGHGTDIAGSIRYPAYACGVHGLRPSLGRVPAMNFSGPDRHIGAQLMAVSGPIARTVGDLRVALHAMAAPDPRDPWWTPVPLEAPAQPRRVALAAAPSGLRVADAVLAALYDAAARLRDAGWTVDEVDCPDLREAAQLNLLLWLAEYRRTRDAAVIREADPDASFVLAQMQRHSPVPDFDGLLDALQARARLAREWSTFLADYPVVLCPVSAQPPFPDQLDVSSPAAFDRVLEAQVPQMAIPLLGLPGLAVSTGCNGTVPIGVQLVGARFREDTLLAAGEAIERAGVPPAPIEPLGAPR